MTKTSYQIILLAAGRGSRLNEKTARLPKCLVPIQDKPLLVHWWEQLQKAGECKVCVVGGYQFPLLKKAVSELCPTAPVKQNSDFLKGNLITLLKGKEWLQGSSIIMNADHLFSTQILSQVFQVANQTQEITVFCDEDRPLGGDDMKIKLNKSGAVDIMGKSLTRYQKGYIGITFIPEQKMQQYLLACKHALNDKGEQICVEEVINTLCHQGEQVAISDVSGSHWLEVDTPEDLKNAEQLLNQVKMTS